MADHRRPDQATTEPKEDAGDEASPSPAEEPAETLEDTFEEDFAHHLQQQLDDDLHELQVPAASWVETRTPIPYHSTYRRRPRHLPSISDVNENARSIIRLAASARTTERRFSGRVPACVHWSPMVGLGMPNRTLISFPAR